MQEAVDVPLAVSLHDEWDIGVDAFAQGTELSQKGYPRTQLYWAICLDGWAWWGWGKLYAGVCSNGIPHQLQGQQWQLLS